VKKVNCQAKIVVKFKKFSLERRHFLPRLSMDSCWTEIAFCCYNGVTYVRFYSFETKCWTVRRKAREENVEKTYHPETYVVLRNKLNICKGADWAPTKSISDNFNTKAGPNTSKL